jgi:hypothetical protein
MKGYSMDTLRTSVRIADIRAGSASWHFVPIDQVDEYIAELRRVRDEHLRLSYRVVVEK